MDENTNDTAKEEQVDENTSNLPDEAHLVEKSSDAEPSHYIEEEPEDGVLERVLLNMGVVGELLLLFIKGDRWWMAPLVLLLCVLGAVLVVLNSLEYVAPFIYMAF